MRTNYKTLLSNIIFSLIIIFIFQNCTSNQASMVDYTQLKMQQIGESKVAFLNDEKYTATRSIRNLLRQRQ